MFQPVSNCFPIAPAHVQPLDSSMISTLASTASCAYTVCTRICFMCVRLCKLLAWVQADSCSSRGRRSFESFVISKHMLTRIRTHACQNTCTRTHTHTRTHAHNSIGALALSFSPTLPLSRSLSLSRSLFLMLARALPRAVCILFPFSLLRVLLLLLLRLLLLLLSVGVAQLVLQYPFHQQIHSRI